MLQNNVLLDHENKHSNILVELSQLLNKKEEYKSFLHKDKSEKEHIIRPKDSKTKNFPERLTNFNSCFWEYKCKSTEFLEENVDFHIFFFCRRMKLRSRT